MKYEIKHETKYSVRLRLEHKSLSDEQASAIEYKLLENKDVTGLRFFKSLGGINISFTNGKEDILKAIENMNLVDLVAAYRSSLQNVQDSNGLNPITAGELKARSLDAKFKRSLQKKVVVEAVSDLFLPTPVQFVMHAHEYMTIARL